MRQSERKPGCGSQHDGRSAAAKLGHYLLKPCDNVSLLIISEERENRKREACAVVLLSALQADVPQEMAVIRLVIDRNIVDLRHDALGPQRVVDLLPAVYMHDEQMVGGQIAVRRAEAPRWRSGELPEVSLRYGAAALQELRELLSCEMPSAALMSGMR